MRRGLRLLRPQKLRPQPTLALAFHSRGRVLHSGLTCSQLPPFPSPLYSTFLCQTFRSQETHTSPWRGPVGRLGSRVRFGDISFQVAWSKPGPGDVDPDTAGAGCGPAQLACSPEGTAWLSDSRWHPGRAGAGRNLRGGGQAETPAHFPGQHRRLATPGTLTSSPPPSPSDDAAPGSSTCLWGRRAQAPAKDQVPGSPSTPQPAPQAALTHLPQVQQDRLNQSREWRSVQSVLPDSGPTHSSIRNVGLNRLQIDT